MGFLSVFRFCVETRKSPAVGPGIFESVMVSAGTDSCQSGNDALGGSSAIRAMNSSRTIADRASASSIKRSARRVIGSPSAWARKYNRVTRSRRSCGEYHFARGIGSPPLEFAFGSRPGRLLNRNGGQRMRPRQIHITRIVDSFQRPKTEFRIVGERPRKAVKITAIRRFSTSSAYLSTLNSCHFFSILLVRQCQSGHWPAGAPLRRSHPPCTSIVSQSRMSPDPVCPGYWTLALKCGRFIWFIDSLRA